MPEPRADLLDQAWLVGTWGHLLLAGAPEAEALECLGAQGPREDLRRLARACRGAGADAALGEVLDAEGAPLRSWLRALLAPAPREGAVLAAAAEVLRREADAGRWHEGLVWAKLRLVHRAGGAAGDACSGLAREARDRERPALAEALYGAAKRVRQGTDLPAALLAEPGAWPLPSRLVLARAEAGGLDAALERLEALGALARPAAPGAEDADDPIARVAEAATAGAAPLRRGFQQVLSGLGEALGIERRGSGAHADLVREAVAARKSARAEPGPTQPAAKAPADAPAEAGPAPEEGPGPSKKTIGGDSGPVVINELHGGPGDASEERQREREDKHARRAAWRDLLERARSQMTVLEVEGDGPTASELEVSLATLRADAKTQFVPPDMLRRLGDLEARYAAWRAER